MFPLRHFPCGGEVLQFENCGAPLPRGRARFRCAPCFSQSERWAEQGRLGPSIRHSSAPRVTGPSLRTVWMSSCALCRPPEAASCSRRAGWVSCGSQRSPLLHPDSCSGAGRGLHSGALSAPGDPRIRGSSSPGLRRRAMDVPGSEHEPPSGHRSVPGREGLPLGTQAGTLLTAPGLLGP